MNLESIKEYFFKAHVICRIEEMNKIGIPNINLICCLMHSIIEMVFF